MNTVLVIDDNNDIRENIAELLRVNGYRTKTAVDGQLGYNIIKRLKPDAIILDLKLPKIDGWQILKKLEKEINRGLCIIVITAYGEIAGAVKAMKMGAYDFLEKPFNSEVLLLTLEKGIKNFKVRRELDSIKKTLAKSHDGNQIFGTSDASKGLIKQMNTIAPTDLNVLLLGENGSGKEVVANFIHKKSKRNTEPFITVDCGAISESLIVSELFGFEKGSFTGAVRTGEGKFKTADKGTLYLDEIGNLKLEQQRHFLRAVDTKTFTPIGSNHSIKVDTRLICATNENLEISVQNKTFRQDLFYRLSEFTITVPSLRDRIEDIPFLVKTFINEIKTELNSKVTGISEDGLHKLYEYNWPGNVRQLKNIIRRAMLFAHDEIQPEHIKLQTEAGQRISVPDNHAEIITEKNNYKKTLTKITEQAEEKLIKQAISKAHGNITKAAKLYGIDRSTFYLKMDKHNIDREL